MLNENDLANFTGSLNNYRWSALFPRVLLSEGALHVAKNGGQHGAYWLMDAIASYQPKALKIRDLQDFQLWILKVKENKSAVLTCQIDSDVKPSITQKIEYTDFDLSEITFYCNPCSESNRLIFLPSEY